MTTLRRLILAATLGLLSSAYADSILLSDDFSGSALNTNLWTTILPYDTSSVTQSGGELTTAGRGILATNAGFTGPYIINGAFTMNDDLEHFNVVFRSDLSSTDSYNERTGMIVTFVNDGNGIAIQQYTNPMSNWTQLAQTDFNLVTGQTYFFSILDTGTSVSLSVDGVSLLTADTTYSTGDQVGFYSREFPGSSTSIDDVNIVAVPEGGMTVVYLGVAFIGLVSIRFLTRRCRAAWSA